MINVANAMGNLAEDTEIRLGFRAAGGVGALVSFCVEVIERVQQDFGNMVELRVLMCVRCNAIQSINERASLPMHTLSHTLAPSTLTFTHTFPVHYRCACCVQMLSPPHRPQQQQH